MALMDIKELKIFSLNRLKFQELWSDAQTYIKQTYTAVGQSFTPASPFAQLLQVCLNLARMVFYYIEDSITGLNIRTAYRPDQIKGLAQLVGHDAARPISSRGAVRISYVDNGDSEYTGQVCYIPNKTTIVSKINGLNYILFLNTDQAKITMQTGNYLDGTIIQGKLKLQQATGTGMELQSFNFAERNYAEIDQYYVNIYVNGEPWTIVNSLLDLGFNQKGCIVRTGLTGGIDVFFGNGDMGYCPPAGASIIAEYIVSDGLAANIAKENANGADSWEISGSGTTPSGTSVTLNDNFKVTCLTDVIFGTLSEDTALTQLLAPHTSRSFVLANEANYQYFFRRMNMFSDVEIIQGTSSEYGASMLQLAYDQATSIYETVLEQYNSTVSLYGSDSTSATEAYQQVQSALSVQQYAKQKLQNNQYRDNTVYIYLVPDITKRISSSKNYFTCDESLFSLTEDEQTNIINLINASGQRLITVENRIVQPKQVRFALNVQVKVWEGYNEQDVYSAGLSAVSNYLLSFTRQDILPISDIVSIFENDVNGIDSVRAWFDADVDNETVYGEDGFYGIDKYGDIQLTRDYVDDFGQTKTVRDILVLLRGGFVSPSGVEYSATQSYEETSAYNLIVTGYSKNRRRTLENYTPLT